MIRDFKGVWIPKEIWLSKDLTIMEKLFLVEIDSLDNEKNCYASNKYFSEFFGLSKNRSSEIITSLKEKDKINIKFEYETNSKVIKNRIINVLDKSTGGIRKVDRGTREIEGGYSEKGEDNNTVVNNTTNKTINILTPLEKTIEDFKVMRKTIKKPLTPRALELMLKKLDGLADTDDKKILILEQSIMSCYQGIFPLKEETNGSYKQGNKPSSSSEYDFSKYTG
jgi:hypothetical protein